MGLHEPTNFITTSPVGNGQGPEEFSQRFSGLEPFVDADVAAAWVGRPPTVWWQGTLAHHTYTLTAEHIRVAVFLGVFSALYFIVAAASDRTLRATLTTDVDAHVRQCLAVRAVYRDHAVLASVVLDDRDHAGFDHEEVVVPVALAEEQLARLDRAHLPDPPQQRPLLLVQPRDAP